MPPLLPITLRGAALALALVAAGCATRPAADDPEGLAEYRETNDPFEPANRAMFEVHEVADRYVLQPVAEAYRDVVPQPLRTGIRNVLGNIRAPVILANDLMQGNISRARITLGRFMVNSTIGVGGIIDVAREWGVPGHSEDFGQTLAVWGAGEGFYMFVPLFGPSSPRDLAGQGVDILLNPLMWLGQGAFVDASGWVRLGLTVVDTREALIEPIDQVRATSLDPYSTLRSAYRQRRAFEIRNQESPGGEVVGPSGVTGFGQGVTEPGGPDAAPPPRPARAPAPAAR
ncbi:VacJ family lipoprotein [Roseomonas sp. CECT 9278]|uniref:MlaA family lipoprotein n=1 Tax=Roseomonas sp. CECT 9278 TaxID=2845823 RepID=UPI001E306274|nr:VacJ family lipoprotein [Roseomonas sp. CECT 9278]CAH0298018.1 Intermembrane phospholipid transport system lipoprotein MlaA [Roseomonas sp. CECT 9278]